MLAEVNVDFLSPLAAIIGLAAAVPIAAAAVRERRHQAIRAAIGLDDPPAGSRLREIAIWVVVFGLLAAAAAQPVIHVPSTVEQRTDAEAYVVIDTTRSMLAASSADGPKRIERAREVAANIRRALPDVPFGVASHTNRPLVHLFPSADAEEFELVLNRSIGINRPPGTRGRLFTISTDFQTLVAMGSANFFSAGSTKRLVIFLSDSESGAYAVRALVDGLRKGGVDLLLVRLWDADERVWQKDGRPEAAYRPDELSLERFSDLATLTTGGRVYGEGELDAIVAAARAYLGTGPVVQVAAPGHTISLAPYAVLAACVPLAFLLLPGLIPARRRRVSRLRAASEHVVLYLGLRRGQPERERERFDAGAAGPGPAGTPSTRGRRPGRVRARAGGA